METFTFLFTRVTIDAGGVSICWDFNSNTACCFPLAYPQSPMARFEASRESASPFNG